MNSEEPKKLYHFYGGCCTKGLFFIQKIGLFFSFGFGKYGELSNDTESEMLNVPKIDKKTPKIGKVSKIAIGFSHTLFLMSPKDNVYGVGYSKHGSLSVKFYVQEVLSPILVTSDDLHGVKIGDISCGIGISVLLSKNGVVYSCGHNVDGQCGVGTYSDIFSAIPMKIKEKIIQIDCGGYFTILLTNKRDVYKTGEIGHEGCVNIPTKLKLDEKVKYFRAGGKHLLVVGRSGQLYGMGSNVYKQLTSELSFEKVNVLTKITINGKIKDIKCSFRDSYVLMDNNDLYGWGINEFGQSKGNGTISTIYDSYNSIPFKMKSNVMQIEVCVNSCFVFCKEGVYVCGNNERGELGMGNLINISKLTLNKRLKNIEKTVKIFFIPKFDPKMLIFDVTIKMN